MSLRLPGNVARPRALDSIYWRCTQHLFPTTSTPLSISRSFSQTFAPRNAVDARQSRLKTSYFLSNGFLPRNQDGDVRRSTASTTPADEPANRTSSTPVSHVNQDLPHRRRQAARRKAAAAAPPITSTAENPLPAEDASSALTTSATKHSASSLRRQLSLYLSLSKPRLTVLVVLSAMAPYALYPVPDFLSPSIGLDTPSLSPLTLAFLTTGTALCSASANALNMLYEPKTDAMMSRTRNRPLVRGLLSARKAVAFAVLAALTGVGGLYFGVNPTVAFLGATNIVLYAGVYTPMKRLSWLNTWVGAIVGGIPPLMGWAAAAGESATGTGSFDELLITPDAVGGWLLAALLFAWQFPHFMALSWSIKEEYKAAGHQMLCWVNPARNARVALRYSLAFFPICLGLCAAGVTEWSFAVTSMPVNVWLTREAIRFWKHEGFHGSARGLFWASVWHLPAVMVLALAQKKGMWGRVWRAAFGEPVDMDDEEYWDGDE
ncbi:UbiA prenyltransferase family-domain-containing protein [Pseudomassariella vexata]|uniref:Protoheme IX farnesyltransferase, mitochondrial n=1 Tax=Pseudomassariella vexata TaxID=1141098 RepID=A0A1Y2EFJ3_9PEZI|nr:UbiA prenyltransferase family-domain-containing protein [Pseudomassariella vexata]ORY70340.1 UbiA prenyltransferase family-domain-containing protein [Pseudomassariella vexata]